IRHPLVDCVVVNEGEVTALELADALLAGRDLGQVSGIGFKDSGRVIMNAERPQLDLEKLPRLDYSLVDLKDYFTVGHISRSRQLQIVTSRGCPFRCAYCYLTLRELRGYRWLSAVRVQAEV